jgi:hypothetical protein
LRKQRTDDHTGYVVALNFKHLKDDLDDGISDKLQYVRNILLAALFSHYVWIDWNGPAPPMSKPENLACDLGNALLVQMLLGGIVKHKPL